MTNPNGITFQEDLVNEPPKYIMQYTGQESTEYETVGVDHKDSVIQQKNAAYGQLQELNL